MPKMLRRHFVMCFECSRDYILISSGRRAASWFYLRLPVYQRKHRERGEMGHSGINEFIMGRIRFITVWMLIHVIQHAANEAAAALIGCF